MLTLDKQVAINSSQPITAAYKKERSVGRGWREEGKQDRLRCVAV